ncbi:hypothetical protein BZA05DRAFT_278359 [Tricharina praecox]|uniref:uncharacterized protein n=1 Tax=Tricharina praecox TaxID=43433 RepID=UPI002220FCC0|nr:uncharacterized protein BZA05DRAFT_278359 [Tricharina praecox]KAI5840145.1 hypothetical protein BZA05DRAFT_278359 [Tricharina praecox]
MVSTSYLETVLEYSPSETQSPSHPRTLIFSYLNTHSLLSLRSCSRTLKEITSLYALEAFKYLQLIFKAGAFCPAAIAALGRIGTLCTHLTITLRHSDSTVLTLPPRLPEDKDRIFSFFHIPRDGFWDETGRYRLEEHTNLVVAEAEAQGLWEEASRVAGWARVFGALPGLKRVDIVTLGEPVGKGLARDVVDEALISVRHVMEDRSLVRGLTGWGYSGHACGVWVLNPEMAWEGRGVRKSWWARLTEVDMMMTRESLVGMKSWETGAVDRAWRTVLKAMSGKLVKLSVAMTGIGPGLACPLVEETLEFPKLKELTTSGFFVAWNNHGGFEGLLGRRARNVKLWIVEGMRWMEGEQGWVNIWEEWDALQWTRGFELVVMRRKGTWESDLY